MSVADFLIILLAGIGAGTINTVVGSGSLITFPTLVALGYPPLLANVSNNVGLVPGGVSGVYGYRRELVGQRTRLRRLVPASILGSLTGATLLLVLPSSLFDKVVVVLIGVALVLVVVQPTLSRRLAARRAARPGSHHDATLGVQVLVASGRRVRRLLRRRAGHHPHRDPRDHDRRPPAASQRLQERAGRHGQRSGRDRLHPRHRRRLAGCRWRLPWAPSSVARSAPGTAAASTPRLCAASSSSSASSRWCAWSDAVSAHAERFAGRSLLGVPGAGG